MNANSSSKLENFVMIMQTLSMLDNNANDKSAYYTSDVLNNGVSA